MLRRTTPGTSRDAAAQRAARRRLVQLASLGLALVVWTSGCAGSAGAADASSCPGGPGCADTAAPDGTHIRELPDAPSSHLVASPTPLEFGYVGLGQRPQLTLTVANTGSAPVTLTGFRLAGHLSFTLDGLHPDDPVGWSAASAASGVSFVEPIRLAPGESSSRLRMTFRALEVVEAHGVLTLLTDATPSELDIPLHATVGSGPAPVATCAPDLPGEVDFGCVPTGARVEREVTIAACDGEDSPDLVLFRIELDGQAGARFALDLGGLPRGGAGVVPGGTPQLGPDDPPVVIPAGTKASFRVIYVGGPQLGSPTLGSWGTDGDVVRLYPADALVATTLAVRGASFDPACPSPTTITVKEGPSVEPGTLLHLRGVASFGCASAPPYYSWTVTQPSGAADTFSPGSFSETPTFAVSSVGAYVFGLTVLDSAGHPQCAPAASTVNVGAASNLSVVLSWKTPGDADPTDEGAESSADLDLHFQHPAAEGFDVDEDGSPDGWFDEFYDCFWFNTDPSWGTPNPNLDNGPHLKPDAPGGTEYETLTMAPLSEPRQYKVGVHVWSDHGFGPSLATVRVLVGGELAYEVLDVPLNHLDMWEVATIDWPTGEVHPIQLPSGARKILPDYDSDFFPVP
jgi:hypothetical protein